MIDQGPLLGVNIDHVGTLRQARGTSYPEPIFAAQLAEQAGADGITLHLREDRRHIQDRDVTLLKSILQTRMNLEMAVTSEMIAIALKIKPEYCCLVPEKREELTTEGGLDVAGQFLKMKDACSAIHDGGAIVSLFIDPDEKQIIAAKEAGATTIELHTGCYADAVQQDEINIEYERIKHAAHFAEEAGLVVNAGHGLHYRNVKPIAAISQIHELNIGHSIVAQALFVGFSNAVVEMKRLILEGRASLAVLSSVKEPLHFVLK